MRTLGSNQIEGFQGGIELNIDDYRALKAKMEEEEKAPEKEVEEPATKTPEPESTPEATDAPEDKPNVPETIEIDGKEITIDELKNGYLRQSDYTRKTQEASRKAQQAEEALKVLEQIQSNPQVAQTLSQQIDIPDLSPEARRAREMEDKYYDLYIETQVKELTDKYGDFDVVEVLETARDNNIPDLDTAYHVVQSRKGGGAQESLNVDELRKQIRDEVIAEIAAQREQSVDTGTIIDTGGSSATQVQDDTPKLSAKEMKVAQGMGISPVEYAQWRDIKKKR